MADAMSGNMAGNMAGNMTGSPNSRNLFFRYNPSTVGAGIAAVVFILLTIAHIFLFIKSRNSGRPKMLILFAFAAFNEASGWGLRIPGAYSDPSGMLFTLSPMILLFTPIMATSVIYIVFAKLINSTPPTHTSLSPMRASLVVKIWSVIDVIGQVLISVGAMILGKGNTALGKPLLLSGLGFHSVLIMGFLGIVGMWHRRVNTSLAPVPSPLSSTMPLNLWCIYIATGLIHVRGTIRFMEIATGPDGFFQMNEIPFYIYDFAFISIAFTLCLKWYGTPDMIPYSEKSDMEMDDTVTFAHQGAAMGKV